MTDVEVNQKDNFLKLNFEKDTIAKLYLKNEFNSICYEPIDDDFSFKIDLNEVINVFKHYETNKIYLIVEESDIILTTQKNLKVNNAQTTVSDLSEVINNEYTIHPYITKNGFLHLSMAKYTPSKVYFSRRHIDSFKFNNQEAKIEGQFSLVNATLQNAYLVIGTRFTTRKSMIDLPINIIKKTKRLTYVNFSLDAYQKLIEFMKYPFENGDVIDIYLEIDIQESKTPIEVKLGNPRIIAERFLKGEIITDYEGEIISITPYLTMKGRNLSFRINRYTIDSYLTYIENLKKPNVKLPFQKNHQKVWVVGEKSYKAQDNGFHFFKYMRTHYPELPVYYIIEEDSNEAQNVLPFGNVIYYKSPEHFNIMLQADYICTTHHPELIFPTNSAVYTKKVKATRVFLQHGVLGAKNLSNINGNQLKDFNVDLFITSSEREKQIVVRDLKFDSGQVAVTGLARFDNLFNPKVTTKNQILIIPTWRDWLINWEQIEHSEYLLRINNLLNSPNIKNIVDNGNEVIFCLHPNMQPFIELFNVPSYITSVKQGDIDVQKLIQESKLMITDYSSVAFDFSFLNKPVLYYQFDKGKFLGKQPSHLDIENELPGTIVNNQQDLEKQLKKMIINNYQIDKNVEKKANQFIKYRDQYNSQRIFEAAQNYKTTNRLKSKFKYDILSQHLFKRFRRSKKYFNLMDKYNSAISKVVPVKKDLVVFESNVGKSVSDSPKVIYDKLKEYSNAYQIVWVSNQQFPFNDPNVITVKRLSPEYYHYLSRAKYWVNNQNFPHYITKPKDTIYIQTWHGTPLKKMLNDVESFEGRDANYKNRVNNAIKYWDYLVSPSPYASRCFRSAFEFHKEILEVGYPRNDIFYNKNEKYINDKKEKIKQRLGIQDNRKIILYAPTFRDDEINKAKKHIINLKIDLQQMKEQLSEDYILILRPHVIISNALQLDHSLDDFVINGSKYNDISDLFLITDICITDYSSVMFDYANTKKPMIFFTYDLDHYKNNLRGFYFDFENEAPGPLIKKNNELIIAIKNIEEVQKKYQEKYEQFYNKFCTFEDGNATTRIIERVFT
ncbi:CDP-glycerol:poly(glycerophosphate) glycerophosphotransferase [Staphylococcus cohnii subsp. cohnii]|nr:CDP-glycerol:poly(glycerophosphate) glycerophosphotransferase [Staphylococcus cohnii subsp. cohnii]